MDFDFSTSVPVSNPDAPVRETKTVEEILAKSTELREGLLTLGFTPPRNSKQSNALTEKNVWKPGLVVRDKAFYFTHWNGREFHEIKEQQPDIFAVVNYYLQHDGQAFAELEAVHHASPNAIIVIHDHTIHHFCTPWSACKELPWTK